MPTSNGVIPQFLAMRDMYLGRKFLSSPEGQQLLSQFQQSAQLPPALASQAAKRPPVASAVDMIRQNLGQKEVIEGQRASTEATRGGEKRAQADFNVFGMSPTAVNAKSNQEQVGVQKQGLEQSANNTGASFLADMLGSVADPNQRKVILEAGSKLQGPVGDIIRQLLSAKPDAGVLDAVNGLAPQPGDPNFTGPVQQSPTARIMQDLVKSRFGFNKQNPYFPVPQVVEATEAVAKTGPAIWEFLSRIMDMPMLRNIGTQVTNQYPEKK